MFILCFLLQINSTISAAVFGSALAAGDSITWTKGEILGRGAYGIVRMLIYNTANEIFRHNGITRYVKCSLDLLTIGLPAVRSLH